MNLLTSKEFNRSNDQGRILTVNSLRQHFMLPSYDVELANKSTYAPTLGIEVEVSWSQKFPDFTSDWLKGRRYFELSRQEQIDFSAACTKLEEEHQQPYADTLSYGIPKGKDGFWEFAHAPTKQPQIIMYEINTLYDVGLLEHDTQYSLHLTVGGVPYGRDAYFLASLLELGGGTTQERIYTGFDERAWSRLGSAGIKQRRPEELEGDDEGFEIRTLCLLSPAQLQQTLEFASYYGELINQARFGSEVAAGAWEVACNHVSSLLKQAGITDASRWPEPHQDPELWACYAALVELGNR